MLKRRVHEPMRLGPRRSIHGVALFVALVSFTTQANGNEKSMGQAVVSADTHKLSWPMAREKTMVAELKRLRPRKINMSHDAKGDSRAGKPPPLSSLEPVVLRSLGWLERTLLFLCTLQTQEQFPRGSVPMRF
jgi:hypothetical protein